MTSPRAFTVKSISVGILGILIITGLASFNDNRLGSNLFIGNHFPIGAYFFLFIISIAYNPIANIFSSRLVLSTKELCVAHAMTLAACWVPTSGLFRYFHRQLIMPFYFLDSMKGWKKWGVLDYIPSHLIPLGADSTHPDYDMVYTGFVQGLARGNDTVGFDQIPLDAWSAPMGYWLPILLAFALMLASLALLVHRQWVHHEHISYPLAKVASSLFMRSENQVIPDVFRNKLFWLGCAPVILIHLTRFLAQWNPGDFPSFDMHVWMKSAFDHLMPNAPKTGLWQYGHVQLLFTVVGLTYFISTGTAFSLAISEWALLFLAIQYMSITGDQLAQRDRESMVAGSYLGYAAILLFTGRHYYTRVLLRAMGIGKHIEDERVSVHAARIFLVASTCLWGMLTIIVEIDWFIALLYTLGIMLFYMVATRTICEAGVPFFQAGFKVGYLLPKLLGYPMLGPKAGVLLPYLGNIFSADPRECLMPYVATGLKTADDAKVNLSKLLHVITIGTCLALVVGFSVSLVTFYNFGAASSDRWATQFAPKKPLYRGERAITEIDAQGLTEVATHTTGLARLSFWQFDGEVWSFFSFGIALVAITAFLRFRYSGFFLHPVLFLVWGTYSMGKIWSSIMIGWAIKLLIVKFGGGKSYELLKPLFIGLIMGELIAGGGAIAFGFIYYAITGITPGTVAHLGIFPN